MIIVKTLKVTDDRKSISVSLETQVGNTFTSLLFWTSATYPIIASAIDLSSLYYATDETELFFITTEDVGIEEFNGMYFLEFKVDGVVEDEDCQTCAGNTVLESVSDFSIYEDCLFNKVLKLDLTCPNSLTSENNLETANVDLILTSLQIALKNKWFTQAIRMEEILKEYCGIDCTSCEHLIEYSEGTGLDKGKLNDTILLK